MGKYKDPVTGEIKDDGKPDVPALPGAIPLPTSLFGPKPEHEKTVTSEQRLESPAARTAALRSEVASGAQLNANEQEQQVAGAEAGVTRQGAGEKEAELARLKSEQAAISKEQDDHYKQASWADAAEVADMAKKHIAAGRARADYWKGNAGGEIFAAVLRGLDRASSSFRGESGPTGVDRVLEAKFAEHERALVAEWEASKEAHELKAKDRNAYAARLAEKKINAANQSALEVQVIGARLEKNLAALGPERAAAVRAAKDALEMKAQALAEQNRVAGYEEVRRAAETNRSPTATAGANKALSEPTRDLIIGAEKYAELAERQRQLIEANGGQVPVKGPEGREFSTNDKKMAAILQKPLGKSEDDAKTARGLQGTPSVVDLVGGKLGLSDPVAKYKRSLEVNTKSLVEEANKAAALEGRQGGVEAAPAATPVPGPVKEFTDKSGRKFKGRRLPDGRVEEVGG